MRKGERGGFRSQESEVSRGLAVKPITRLGITLKETRVYQEIKEEGREEGREEATIDLIIRLLTKRFGEISQKTRSSISSLPLPVLKDLSEALLDFTSLDDLQSWLEVRINK